VKRFLGILLLTLAFAFSLHGQEHTSRPNNAPPSTKAPDNGGWVQFNSDEGNFSVLMPEIPTDKVETTNSAHGPYTTHLFVVFNSDFVYLIGWVDYQPSFNFNRTAELEANRDNFVKGINGTLQSTHSTTIDGYPVIEFTAQTADRNFKSRVYMSGRRPYQIAIGWPKGMDDPLKINRFIDSFKLNQPGATPSNSTRPIERAATAERKPFFSKTRATTISSDGTNKEMRIVLALTNLRSTLIAKQVSLNFQGADVIV